MSDALKIDLSNIGEFQSFFERYYIPLCVFAFRYVDDHATANDIVQECFLKLWEYNNKIDYVHQAKSFMFTSIRNKALNELKRHQVIESYAQKMQEREDESFFYDNMVEGETYRILAESIEKLPPRMREIILLALEGKSNPEIADALSISVETVHTLKKKAYVKLRASMKDSYYYLLLFLLTVKIP